jgi:signal transduction histidine kinase
LRHRAWLVLGGGMGFTLLAAALGTVSVRGRARQERLTADVLGARDALAAAEKERERLGHDLHDGAIQSLYAIQLGLTRTAQDVESTLPSSARLLDSTRERVDEVIAELRQFIQTRERKQTAEKRVRLDQVLASMVEHLRPTTGTKLTFTAQPDAARRVSAGQAVHLTQIARTALANALRHAQARRVVVTLRNDGSQVELTIEDDGIGFEPNQRTNGGMGLQTMRSRVIEAGGTLVVDSKPGAGTRIVVTFPLSVDESPGEDSPGNGFFES